MSSVEALHVGNGKCTLPPMTDTPQTASFAAAATDRPWSVALSGGGHRASLFAAGVLLYLADSGENKRVSSVASVSGGSITNGVLAHATEDFDDLDGDGLRRVLRKLISSCSLTGTVQYAWEAKLVIGAALAAFVGGVGGIVWCVVGRRGGRGYGALLLVVSVLLFIALYESISWVADRVFNRMFFGSSLLQQVTSDVTHVFCATELQSRLHLYMSQRFVYNRSFTSHPVATGRVRLSTAVQASACFPPVFPTRKLRATRTGLPTRFAPRTWLADGGVYDNMGDQWARGYWENTSANRDGEVGFTEMGPVPGKLLVVNASTGDGGHSASWINRVPLLGDLYALKAESDVMYKETTATRRADMWAQFDLARQLVADGSPLAATQLGGSMLHIATPATWPHPERPRPAGTTLTDWDAALQGLTALSVEDRNALEDAAKSSARVATTLAAVSRDAATDLLWHGYTLAMVNFVIFEGHSWAWKAREHFAELTT
jgi:hypothetical protein